MARYQGKAARFEGGARRMNQAKGVTIGSKKELPGSSWNVAELKTDLGK
jgi:hypothetical protein